MNRTLRSRAIPFGLVCSGLLAVIVTAGMCAAEADARPGQDKAGDQKKKVHTPIRDQEHVFRRNVKSWLEIRNQNIVMQQRDYSCGAAALATLIRYHWEDPITETQILQEVVRMLTIEEMKDRIQKGLSLTDLRRVSVRMGYQATIGKLEFDKLKDSKIPLIVGIIVNEYDHFVVFRGTDDVWVYLADPARGNIRIPVHEFKEQWQKNAVLVVVKPKVEPIKTSPLSLDPVEVFLGETNRLYLRDRLTGRTGETLQIPRP